MSRRVVKLEGLREEVEASWWLLELVVILNTAESELLSAGDSRKPKDRHRTTKGQRTTSNGEELSEKEPRRVKGTKEIGNGNREDKPATSTGETVLGVLLKKIKKVIQ